MNSMSSDDPDTIRFHRFVPPEEDDEIEAQARFFGVTVDQMIKDVEKMLAGHDATGGEKVSRQWLGSGKMKAIALAGSDKFNWRA